MEKTQYNPQTFASALPAEGWAKSSFSGADPQGCVEWQPLPGGGMALRDSVFPENGALMFTSYEWTKFLKAVENGELA